MNLQERVKICAISGCPNRSTTIPTKMFFWAPRDFGIKGLWIFATGKKYTQASRFVVCEDHFDLTKDREHVKSDGKPLLKKFVIPHLKLGDNEHSSSAGRSSTMANIFCVDRACQTDFIESASSGIKRKTVDSSTSMEQSADSSKPTESSGSVYTPDTEEPELESEDGSESEDECESEDDDVVGDSSLDSYESRVMCELTIKLMKKNMQHYTGIPESSAYITDLIVERKLMSERNLFLVLRKLRHDESFQILADLFGTTRQHAGHVFTTCLEVLAFHLEAFVCWPSSTNIKLNLPLLFKHKYKNVESIFDCFETSIAKPTHSVDQALTWSQYKHANTVKHMLSATPDGMINFRSKGYTGRITDNEIVKRCGYLQCIKKGTESMTNRGFKDVRSEVESRGGILHKPPSTRAGINFTKEEAKLCKSVAATRIHIERVIKKLRDFALLKPHRASIPSKRTFLIEYAVVVASAICNMQPHLTKI